MKTQRDGASKSRRCIAYAMLALLGMAFVGADSAPPRFPAEAPFLAENEAAMNKMMAGMEVKPTGDVDRDFIAMMIPHHQGAIDMAQALLRHGHNEQLRRLAQEIIVEQLQEIAVMRQAAAQPLAPSASASDQTDSSPSPKPTGNSKPENEKHL